MGGVSMHDSIRIAAAKTYQPKATLPIPTTLVVLLIVSIVLAVVLIALTIFLSRPRRHGSQTRSHGAHSDKSSNRAWLDRVQRTLDDFSNGDITRDEAFRQLADTARDYAGERTGSDMSTRTLAELNRSERTGSDKQGLDLLRQTIAALYPPEFADIARNAQARDTTVAEAGQWVSTLIERWRR